MFFWMTSHRNSHTKTDVKLELILGVKTGNEIQHNKYDVRGIAQARTDIKDNIFLQRRLYIEHIPHCASNTTFVILVFFITNHPVHSAR